MVERMYGMYLPKNKFEEYIEICVENIDKNGFENRITIQSCLVLTVTCVCVCMFLVYRLLHFSVRGS